MKLRLLITSIGSLLGQNVLDALEHRREQVHIIGTNLDGMNPRVFRCDSAYITPSTDDAEAFLARLKEIVDIEDPHLLIAARDHDTVALGEFARAYPDLAHKVSAGVPEVAAMMQDKLQSWQFAKHHNLQFARTADSRDARAAKQLAADRGFPLLAKPRSGFGSRGVSHVADVAQLEQVLQRDDYIIQEHLDPPADLDSLRAQLELGIPLFFSLPDTRQYAAQTNISRSGTVGEIFCSLNTMVLGRCERSERVDAPALAALTRRYADAVHQNGWYGPFNLQAKQIEDGSFVVFEMNGRISGSTAARLKLGYDEIAQLVHCMLGNGMLADQTQDDKPARVVYKYLTDYSVDKSQAASLDEKGQWHASS